MSERPSPQRRSGPDPVRRVLLAVLAAASFAAVAVSLADLGMDHTLVIIGVLIGAGLLTFLGSEWVMRTRRQGRALTLGSQLTLMIALVMAPLLVALLVLGLSMFVSTQDATLVGVIVVLSGVVGALAAARLSRGVAADVAGIRDALVQVGDGGRAVRPTASSAAELTVLAEQVSTMIADLAREEGAREAAEEARRQLIAHASHDLRTPVTSLRLLAAAVDDDLVDGGMRREYIRRMLTHIEALSGLIDDLFELSRLQAGDISWSLERVAVEELLDATVAAMRPHADAHGVQVRAECPATLAPARANPEKLQRVLFNLIQNAIRHSPSDGTVVVRAESLADMIELEVEDRGHGIPPEDRPRIFDAFYRGGADTSRSTDGAGLGLAIAQAIVDAHGGRIWLPEGEHGTRVRFSVPIAA